MPATLTLFDDPDEPLLAVATGDVLGCTRLPEGSRAALLACAADFPFHPVVPNALSADRRATAHEREIARRLQDALLGHPEASSLVRQLEDACQAEQPLDVCFVVPAAALQRVPWEVLGQRPEGPFRRAQVWRLAPAALALPAAPPRPGLEILLWCPLADDTCKEVRDALRAMAARDPSLVVTEISPETVLPPPHRARVLHIVTHGLHVAPGRQGSDGAVLLLGQGTAHDPWGAAEWLRPFLLGISLVVLDVCGGGRLGARYTPGAILLHDGAPAVLAPALPLPLDTSLAANSALYRALLAGGTLGEAVRAARGALVAVANGHPGRRAWNLVLSVRTSAYAATTRPVRPLALPSGIPLPGPDAVDVIRALLQGADPTALHGVESLARALLREDAPAVREAEQALQSLRVPPWPTGVGTWHGPAGDPPLTPRLRRVFQKVTDGFSLRDLVVALVAESPLGPQGFRRGWGGEATRGIPTRGAVAGALYLEVVGGPEDGRELHLDETHRVVGRWVPGQDPDGPQGLFAFRRPADDEVSRTQLERDGDGRYWSRSRVSKIRQVRGRGIAQSQPREQDWRWGYDASFEVAAGDLLFVGDHGRTMLRVLGG